MSATSDIAENLKAVKDQIAKAATDAGRNPGDINLVAVSKLHKPGRIIPALQAGHRIFGENRVQEAEDKWPSLKEQFPDVRLHLIGPLQTNKLSRAVQLFDVIETVDRPKLARKLAAEMDKTGRRPDCYLQVNTGEEPQKAGVLPGDLDDFIALCRDELNLPVKGLMSIPPVDEEPALHFALLRKLAEKHNLQGLSMGMSGDFDVAVTFGATLVRVGTAIFGDRPKQDE